MRIFRRDILSAQPERLYRAWMAEFRTPFFRSFLVNQPDLVEDILKARPLDFPKSDRVGEGLRPLLGASVFLTNGETWARQRRIIDPAFEGGRLRDTFPAMLEAGRAAVERMETGAQDIEPVMSHAAADVIFRTLFSHADRGRPGGGGLWRIPRLSAQPADPEPARVSATAALDAPRPPGARRCGRRGGSGH
jgi:cytochrome P450